MEEKYLEYLNKDKKFDNITMLGILSLLVVISGCFGFLYEYLFYFFNGGMKTFYWRGGNFLPWINIYATGSIMLYYLTYKYRKKPLKVFLISLLTTGILEYISGWGMLHIAHKRCWDYNNEILNFGNINGFICLRSVLFFAISAILLIYIIIPFIYHLANTMNKKIFLTISFTLCSIILLDEFYNLLFARILNLPRAYDIYSKQGIKYVKFK